jgi:hypothetical protein
LHRRLPLKVLRQWASGRSSSMLIQRAVCFS